MSEEEKAQKLAEHLHQEFCTANHTDGCSFHYNETWDGFAKSWWLEKAKFILNEFKVTPCSA